MNNKKHNVVLAIAVLTLTTVGSRTFSTEVASDTPVQQPEELLGGFVHPPVIFSPGEEFGSAARKYQGIPTIECAPGGRLWAAWYAGKIGEDQYNYLCVAASSDAGSTWSDLKFVVDPDGDGSRRASDPCLWIDPTGKLWLFWWMNSVSDGIGVTMAITTENPDEGNPVWTEPRALFPGVMINKPIVTRNGEWLMPSAHWHRDNSCRVMVSKDNGNTWALRGTANVPEDRRNCDEPMIVQREDGSLWMLVRTNPVGIGESISTDGGRTWTEATDYLHDVTSRFFIRRLTSGNLLLIKHHGVDVPNKIGHRSHLMAFLSDDNGKTWKGGLLLDERITVSYPDGCQSPDGMIHIIYDWNRLKEKNILMAVFTEQDVLAGGNISEKARTRMLVNQATGVNPKMELHVDNAAVPLKLEDSAEFSVKEGTVETLQVGAKIFSDRIYDFHSLPDHFPGRSFVRSSMDRTEATCLESGMAYVFTPTKDRNPDSVETELLAQEFEKTSVPEFFLFTLNNQLRVNDACSVFQKRLTAGEKIRFGKWGVLVCPAADALE